MIMNITYGTIQDSRDQIISYVQSEKTINIGFRVIDLGGIAINGQEDMTGTYSWSSEIADFVVDINAPANRDDCLAIDICDADQWIKLETIVTEKGKFDYAICTHTLEDLYNPITALKKLPTIANAGMITVPSARTELSIVENMNWLGYMHHRWIFDQQDGELLLAPKLTWIEQRYRGRFMYKPEVQEIRYEWQEDLPFKVLMNNYMGPTADVVLNSYDDMVRNIGKNVGVR